MPSRSNLWGLAPLIAGLLVALHTRRAAALAMEIRTSRALPVLEGLIAASWILLGAAILVHSHALFWVGVALVAVFLGGLFDPDWGVQVWLKPLYQIRGRRLGRPMPSNEEMVEEALRVALMTLGTILVGAAGVWLDLHAPVGIVPIAIGMLVGIAVVFLAVIRPGRRRA